VERLRDTRSVVEPTNRTRAEARDPKSFLPADDWNRIEEEFRATGRAGRVQELLTDARDRLAREAFRVAIEAAFPQAAMLAIGAYGRRQTYPYTELDILILLESSRQAEIVKGLLPEFVRLLWDGGLRVNCAALPVPECVEALERASTYGLDLLNRRFLAGAGAVHEKLESKLPGTLASHRQKICDQLCQQARARHARYQNTPYHAEPDVREAPGGLQDLG
jgi:[protein-PII] uridylyltransferase